MESLVIIDDEKIVIDGIQAMMNMIDSEIILAGSATDGISAFDLLRRTSPGICDHRYSNAGNGWTFVD